MSTTEASKEDPLVAALPPATDYITYLTLLEYQLNTTNLSTLNRLLSEDDGTLASEIGWDLLKMVLPMLQVVPDEANKCFAIIARRGNPREVIVRVAEELERLGHNEDDDLSDDLEDDQEELPTFPGEATRIHLGEMKLEGLPEQTDNQQSQSQSQARDLHDQTRSEGAESGSDDALSLQALMSMLSILHPRIKTQHPSRFLATSLPAALGAYRRLTITEATTSSFVSLLGKLSGKRRPALPPRTSTAGSAASLLISNQNATSSAVPLPDPEANAEEAASIQATMANEKAIIQKLLQAVLLEVVDEYTQWFVAQDEVQMQWASRLREKLQPKRVVPGRTNTTQKWEESPELKERDDLMIRFLSLAKDLDLDIQKEISQSIKSGQDTKAPAETDDENDEKEVTDYPQTPADIPLSLSALIILQAAQQFYSTTTTTIPTSDALTWLNHLDSISAPHLSPVIDAILSLITSSLSSSSAGPQLQSSSPTMKSLSELETIFTMNPDPSTRDNAHHTATLLFHAADPTTKLDFIKSILSKQPDNELVKIQLGNLKSIAVNWLKDEFLKSINPQQETLSESSNPLDLETLSDANLTNLIFPSLPSVPGPFISSQPTISTSTTKMSTESDLETFLTMIPFYISGLNLITVLSSISAHHHDADTAPDTQPTSTEKDNAPSNNDESVLNMTPDLLDRVTSFVGVLKTWSKELLGLLGQVGQAGHSSGNKDRDGPVNLVDLFALEDAVGRADAVLSVEH